MIKFILHFPLFFFVLILYNIIAFVNPHWLMNHKVEVSTTAAVVEVEPGAEPPAEIEAVREEIVGPQPIANIPLISGAVWQPLPADILLLIAVVVLYIELFKSTRTAVSSIVEHVLSMFVFIVFLVEFLVVDACGTSAFLIVTMLSLIDVIGGFTITISTARRDFGVGAHAGMGG